MSQLGRISGPLLKANLLRQGVDLAFETDLLYLDVNNLRVGVHTTAPTHDLQVVGTTRTTNLEATNSLQIGTITVEGNTVSTSAGDLNLSPTNGFAVYNSKASIGSIDIDGNVISTNSSNADIELRPQGTGKVIANSDMLVDGNLHVTGNITADGNIGIGNADTDTVSFSAEVVSDIVPDQTDQYSLGSATKRWKDIRTQNLYADAVYTDHVIVNGIQLDLRQGKIIYVASNGIDTNSGTHQNDPFATIKHALSVATVGDTVYVYPGRYEEIFPLEVPTGVTVHGTSLRSVTIYPTAATMYNDAFLIGGEVTVEDFTIAGFHHDPAGTSPYFPGDTNGTGHAFRFKNSALVTTRSPYIRNITVITFGTANVLSILPIKTEVKASINRIKSIISDLIQNNSIAKSTSNPLNPTNTLTPSNGATAVVLQSLFDNVTYIIDNGTLRANLPAITANGTPVTSGMLFNAADILTANKEFLKEEANAYVKDTYTSLVYDEDKTKRDMGYIIDALIYDVLRGGNEHTVYAGLGFWIQADSDPRGYGRGDAGHGALVDGSVMDPASKEASMLFHSVTFITPAAETLIGYNGARIEWLNSFTYFADKSMYLHSGTDGFAGQGKTRIKISTRTGTWSVGDTLSYYDTDGTTVLASGVISSTNGDFFNIDGRVLGFETPVDRPGKSVVGHGNAQLSTLQKKFGLSSLALDGVGDYLTVASQPDFEFGTGDFCLEGWVYRTVSGAYQTIFDMRSTAVDVALFLGITTGNALYCYINGSIVMSGGTVVPLNTWSHIALARSGTTLKMFLNGSQQGSVTDTRNYLSRSFRAGSDYNGTYGFTGFLDDVRVSKGVSRYTGTFTAPTSAFKGDASTVLLLHFNGPNGSISFKDDGITTQDLRTSSGGTATTIDLADYSDFGAEVRAIGSASVYGNYGIYGDGVGVLGYMIGHNLAYIGTLGDTINDPTMVVQTNEIIQLNGAKIFYNSVDHQGDFRVGDSFYVNQRTGEVQFANSDIAVTGSLVFDDGLGNVTTIDPTKVETGNIRISGNTIESLVNEVNISAYNQQINLQSNVNVTGDIDVTGNVTIGGNITIGDQTTDTINVTARIDSDLIPATSSTYDVGSDTKRWKDLYATTLNTDDIKISDNKISTVNSNSNLELAAAGTGTVYVPTNNVQIDQDLTVNGTTYLKDTTIVGNITQTGNVTQTGDVTHTGNLTVNGLFTLASLQLPDIKIDTNYITTTLSSSDLELRANGTGRIYIPTNDVQIDQNLTVNGTAYTGDITSTGTVNSAAFNTNAMNITGSTVTATSGNLVLEAQPGSTVQIATNDVTIEQDLTVNGDTHLKDTYIVGNLTQTGDVTQTGNVNQTGDYTVTGNATISGVSQFQDINITNNTVTTTLPNSDLLLKAQGTGQVRIPNNSVILGQNLTVVGTTTTTNLTAADTVTAPTFTDGNIEIFDNVIRTTVSNSDLELRANGTGVVYVPSNNVVVSQSFTVNGTTNLKTTNITGTLTQTGNTVQVGNYTQTGNINQTGNLTMNGVAQFKDVKIQDNTVSTTLGNNDLSLQASGTGKILVPNNNVLLNKDLTVVGTTTTSNINSTGTVTAVTFTTGNIRINGNAIETTVSNSDLELRANGTGGIAIEQITINENVISSNTNTDIVIQPNGSGIVNVNSTQSIKVPVGTSAQRPSPASAGMVRYNTDFNGYEGYNGTDWIRIDGVWDADRNTYITAELTPGANDNTIRFATNGTVVADLNSTRLAVNNLYAGDVNVQNNTITPLTLNSDLNILSNGTGSVAMGNFKIKNNSITNIVADSVTRFVQYGTGYFKIAGTSGFVIPVGTSTERPALTEVGMIRFNTIDGRVEVFDGSIWASTAGSSSGVTYNDALDLSIVNALIFG